MLSDTPTPTYPLKAAHRDTEKHKRNSIQNPQTHCQQIFFTLHMVDIVSHILPKCTTAVQKDVLLRGKAQVHKNKECTLCDACVWLQCRGKSSRGGEARGGMIAISAVKFEMLRWQISAVSARSDADRYQHTLAITSPHHHPHSTPAWTLPPQKEVMSQQILSVVS